MTAGFANDLLRLTTRTIVRPTFSHRFVRVRFVRGLHLWIAPSSLSAARAARSQFTYCYSIFPFVAWWLRRSVGSQKCHNLARKTRFFRNEPVLRFGFTCVSANEKTHSDRRAGCHWRFHPPVCWLDDDPPERGPVRVREFPLAPTPSAILFHGREFPQKWGRDRNLVPTGRGITPACKNPSAARPPRHVTSGFFFR